MKTIVVFAIVLIAMAGAQERVRVVDQPNFGPGGVDSAFGRPTYGQGQGVLNNVDPAFGRPTNSQGQGVLNNVDPAFGRPTYGQAPNGNGYEPISSGPTYADGGPYQNRPPNSYKKYNNPYLRDAKN